MQNTEEQWDFMIEAVKNLNRTLKTMIAFLKAGYSFKQMAPAFRKDAKSEIYFDLAIAQIRDGFKIVSANPTLGYLIDDKGCIHCISSSEWIWQFDGCQESEISYR